MPCHVSRTPKQGNQQPVLGSQLGFQVAKHFGVSRAWKNSSFRTVHRTSADPTVPLVVEVLSLEFVIAVRDEASIRHAMCDASVRALKRRLFFFSMVKKREGKRCGCGCVYVCVCPPLDKGFPSTTPIRQGGREDLQSSAQRSSLQDPRKRKLITSVYLLPELLTTLSNLPCLFPWFFMLPPPNLFPTADLQQT